MGGVKNDYTEFMEWRKQWRELEKHRVAQTAGREDVFQDYRLRVCSVIRDYGMNERDEVPKHEVPD